MYEYLNPELLLIYGAGKSGYVVKEMGKCKEGIECKEPVEYARNIYGHDRIAGIARENIKKVKKNGKGPRPPAWFIFRTSTAIAVYIAPPCRTG